MSDRFLDICRRYLYVLLSWRGMIHYGWIWKYLWKTKTMTHTYHKHLTQTTQYLICAPYISSFWSQCDQQILWYIWRTFFRYMEYHIMIRDIGSKYSLKYIVIDVISIGKMLPMRMAVLTVSRFGLRIISNKEFEYMASRIFLRWLVKFLFKKSILESLIIYQGMWGTCARISFDSFTNAMPLLVMFTNTKSV